LCFWRIVSRGVCVGCSGFGFRRTFVFNLNGSKELHQFTDTAIDGLLIITFGPDVAPDRHLSRTVRPDVLASVDHSINKFHRERTPVLLTKETKVVKIIGKCVSNRSVTTAIQAVTACAESFVRMSPTLNGISRCSHGWIVDAAVRRRGGIISPCLASDESQGKKSYGEEAYHRNAWFRGRKLKMKCRWRSASLQPLAHTGP
jgi:hypothetical protein